ncbi:universal stress protein [Pontibacter silvestris]|uniref:Universal stress protein n=1 Tax=Pontibacter silvestris TaxID=2305183 RepID=A0ABW4WWT5_9BACT|nr:universal stress protein [Pontibacter silvestris]MCC9137365.1 universal stress protein [Pontibacter silvestris]
MNKASTINKILIPVDIDKAAEALLLLSYAGQFAAALNSELLLLNTSGTLGLTYTEQTNKIHALRAIGDRVLSCNSKKEHVPFECVVRPGSLKDIIKAVVLDYKVDLVLMEADVLPEVSAASDKDHAAVIMELVSCPVMVVPTMVPYKKLSRLVFATDFTDKDNKVLQQIANFTRQADARLTLVQVISKNDRKQLSSIKAAMQDVQKQLDSKVIELKLLEEDDLLEGISDFAELNEADMLILATQDNHLMKRLFRNNYTKTLAYHTRIPLLTFKQVKKKPCSGCCANCISK